MCGIFYVLNKICIEQSICDKLIPLNESHLHWKQSFMKGSKRGPDNHHFSIQNNQIIGFHRLSINGLDEKSNQPIIKNNITLICNGEIYNYKTLWKELNTKPQTNSDCEVIIDLYIKHGIEYTLKCLDGVFAFVIIDKRPELDSNLCFIARDVYGVRPLYTLENYDKEILAVASEMKMLVPFKTNDMNIRHFRPNHYNTFTQINREWKCIDSNPYSGLDMVSMGDYMDNDTYKYCQNIKNIFIHAVRKRIENTDRNVVCLLSGGLDSSLVASIASKYIDNLHTYSIGLDGGEDFKYAKKVAAFIHSKHHEVVVSEDEFFNAIPEVIYNIESYDTTTIRASVGNYLISKYISETSDAKVVLNGDGSDELMGGYLYMHKCPSNLEFDKESRRLLEQIHQYDVLRSDKSISSNGLEPRTPFLDRKWVSYYLSIPIEIRNHNNNNEIEKYLIRKAFNDTTFLPDDVLWRQKEAFSDGVSSMKKSWFEIIEERVDAYYKSNEIDTNELFKKYNNMIDPPQTLEQLYYRDIYEQHYPNCNKILNGFWMPKYVNTTECSARTLDVHDKNK